MGTERTAVVGCADLAEALELFTGQLGFRIETIMPADDPAVAVVSGHGVRLRLERRELVDDDPPLQVPESVPAFTVSRAADADAWSVGRAGMHYRDLIPGRQGGRFIASHIRLPDGGPVPDYVHHHLVRFQAIYCLAGWVEAVYEDQGPPFRLTAGDCVLQPPGIRHRVLASSAGAEVLEIGCPAAHRTSVDHDLELPTPTTRGDRDFGGQRFVRHRVDARGVRWVPWRLDGFACRNTGIGDATNGLAGIRVVRRKARAPATATYRHHGELVFCYVLAGTVTIRMQDAPGAPLRSGDAVVLPGERPWVIQDPSADLELLDATLPDVVDIERLG